MAPQLFRRCCGISTSVIRRSVSISSANQSTDEPAKGIHNVRNSSARENDTLSQRPSLERLSNLWSENSGLTELTFLKEEVTNTSHRFDVAVRSVTDLRREVDQKILHHDEAQKRHAALLMRRDQWDQHDANEFSRITGEEVKSRKELAKARDRLRQAEANAAQCQIEYMDAMRRRYHEEQVWQDKWRVLSTYWTWALIGLNTVVFIGGQFFLQRRETRRLNAIEELINEKFSMLQMETPSAVEAQDEDKVDVTAAVNMASVYTQESIDDSADEGYLAADSHQAQSQAGHEVEGALQDAPHARTTWNQAVKTIAGVASGHELHLPSAAVGAAVGTMFFVAVSAFGRK